ncbi:MAG: hypothetical protein RIC55_27725 [Pirellulaceae bacterium]
MTTSNSGASRRSGWGSSWWVIPLVVILLRGGLGLLRMLDRPSPSHAPTSDVFLLPVELPPLPAKSGIPREAPVDEQENQFGGSHESFGEAVTLDEYLERLRADREARRSDSPTPPIPNSPTANGLSREGAAERSSPMAPTPSSPRPASPAPAFPRN